MHFIRTIVFDYGIFHVLLNILYGRGSYAVPQTYICETQTDGWSKSNMSIRTKITFIIYLKHPQTEEGFVYLSVLVIVWVCSHQMRSCSLDDFSYLRQLKCTMAIWTFAFAPCFHFIRRLTLHFVHWQPFFVFRIPSEITCVTKLYIYIQQKQTKK